MPFKKVNPNRMELLKLKKRLRLAVRGHKLMKDKFEELLKEFFELARTTYRKRKDLEEKLLQAYSIWAEGMAAHEGELCRLLSQHLKRNFTVRKEITKKMGTEHVSFKVETFEETPLYYPLAWDVKVVETLKRSPELSAEVIELAQMEQTLRNVAEELKKTRRRVNALEYVLIPQIKSQIKQVQNKLDELERESRTRVSKVKEMLEKQR